METEQANAPASTRDVTAGAEGISIDDTDSTWVDIEKLQEFAINMTDIKKLKEHGFHTIQSLFMWTKKQLLATKGISEAKMEKILEAAAKCVNILSFRSGTEVMQDKQRMIKITTGAKELDKLLGGGIETMQITEAHGEFRTGKSQLAHTLAVTAQLPLESNGGNGKVCFIDTENTFRYERISQIAQHYGLDPDAVLDNIAYARCYTSDNLDQLIRIIAAKMTEEPYSLVIVDSIMACFRADFSGRGELAERQQKLNHVLSMLMKIAEEFNVAVYLTNQVMATPDAMAFAADKKPIGGHILAHACQTRLALRKGRGEERICKIFDSPHLPEGEAIFAITDGGVADTV